MKEIIPNITENYYAEIFLCGEPEDISSNEGILKKAKEGNAKIIEMLYGFSYRGEKLTYEGTQSKNFQGVLKAELSHQADGSRQVHILILKNAEIIVESIMPVSQLIMHKFFLEFDNKNLAPGDFIEVYVKMQGMNLVRVKDLKLGLVSR